MNNEIIYSDEQETRYIRMNDVIATIETLFGLKVVDIHAMKQREDVNNDFNAPRFPEKKPEALWWFFVKYDSPEGKREGMVEVALEEQELRVVTKDAPHLLFYNEALRERALEEAPPLTKEYLAELEHVLYYAHSLWKIANEYAKDIPDLRSGVYLFHKEFKKVGYLLHDAPDGGPQGLGLRKVYLPEGVADSPKQFITGNDAEI